MLLWGLKPIFKILTSGTSLDHRLVTVYIEDHAVLLKNNISTFSINVLKSSFYRMFIFSTLQSEVVKSPHLEPAFIL